MSYGSRNSELMHRLILIIAALFALSSCESAPQSGNFKTITGAETLSINAVAGSELPRVVAVGNGIAEILVALGFSNSVVGRDIASDIPGLEKVPIVTNGHELSAEKILRANPDLLIIDKASGPRNVIEQVERSGVKVLESPDSFSLKAILEKVEFVAEAIGQPELGRLLATLIKREQSEYMNLENQKQSRVLFLYLRGGNGIFLVGGRGSGADELLSAAGAKDLGSTIYENPFTPINSEAILGLNPDAYLVMQKGLESVGGITEFRNLPGIDPDIPVIAVEDSLLLSFGPRTPNLIKQLHGALYGD